MKNQCHKGLLIPWLRTALERNLFETLVWVNEDMGIFSIVWTHKSAEQWTVDVLKPFRAWAEFKGKLSNKNPKTLKATFRCALNSKKDELRELKRQRNRRVWQFIDPMVDQGKLTKKKGPKSNSKRMTVDLKSRVAYEIFNSSVDSKAEDIFKSTEEKTSKRRKRRTECKPADSIPASPKIEALSDVESQITSCFSEIHIKPQKQSADKLPPFQSICNFQPLTPPHQDNEIFFSSTEYSIGRNSPPDTSRLTPPLEVPPKNCNIAPHSSPYHQQLSTDVWQPNCWPIPSTQQGFNSMNQFSSDLDELSEATIQKSRCDKADFIEMDQFVPVMNMDNQAFYRDDPFSSPSKPVLSENNQMMSDQMKLEDLFNLGNYSEACEKLIQELSSMSSSPDYGGFYYNN